LQLAVAGYIYTNQSVIEKAQHETGKLSQKLTEVPAAEAKADLYY
jgi:hypothetical protein